MLLSTHFSAFVAHFLPGIYMACLHTAIGGWLFSRSSIYQQFLFGKLLNLGFCRYLFLTILLLVWKCAFGFCAHTNRCLLHGAII